ncbi:unnamed protein product [Pylaiella littoralis]
MFDAMNDVDNRLRNKERAMDHVCESLDTIKLLAIHMGDLKALVNIKENIQIHCSNRKKSNN